MSEGTTRRDQVIAAALGVFGRYGYRRTSMELIAQAAGVSRPALYQYFNGKDDVFRAVGRRLLDDLLAAARSAGQQEGTAADRLYGALAVKLDMVAGSVQAEFRGELIAEAAEVIPDVVESFKAGHVAVVETVLSSTAAELDLLGVALSAHDAAVLLLDALTGIAQQKEPPTELRRRLRQLVDLTARSLTARSEQ